MPKMKNNEIVEARERMLQDAFLVEARVAGLMEKVRWLCYAVVLFQKECPGCGSQSLEMLRDSWCQCRACGHECDPTLLFQTCPDCDSRLTKRIYHYWCPHCRSTVRSFYCFEAKVFDADYFCEMMRESRARKEARIEELRTLLAGTRSSPLIPDCPMDVGFSELQGDLDRVVGIPFAGFTDTILKRPNFDMDLYRRHILGLVQGCVVNFDGISALVQDARLDRVFRFIAAVFMDQDGLLEIHQEADGRIRLYGR